MKKIFFAFAIMGVMITCLLVGWLISGTKNKTEKLDKSVVQKPKTLWSKMDLTQFTISVPVDETVVSPRLEFEQTFDSDGKKGVSTSYSYEFHELTCRIHTYDGTLLPKGIEGEKVLLNATDEIIAGQFGKLFSTIEKTIDGHPAKQTEHWKLTNGEVSAITRILRVQVKNRAYMIVTFTGPKHIFIEENQNAVQFLKSFSVVNDQIPTYPDKSSAPPKDKAPKNEKENPTILKESV